MADNTQEQQQSTVPIIGSSIEVGPNFSHTNWWERAAARGSSIPIEEAVPTSPLQDIKTVYNALDKQAQGVFQAAEALADPEAVASPETRQAAGQVLVEGALTPATTVFPAAMSGAIQGVGVFGGRLAKKEGLQETVDIANSLDRRGFLQSEIFDATGLFKGYDGKWRWELDDRMADLMPKAFTPGEHSLKDVLIHPDLFKAYPQLKDMKIDVDPKLDSLGVFRSNGTLTINPEKIRASGHSMKEVIMHELQHAVQKIEGFIPGSNPQYAMERVENALFKRYDEAKTPEAKAEITNTWISLIGKQHPEFQIYYRDPGEIEARTVGRRSIENRKGIRPYKDVDTDPFYINNRDLTEEFRRIYALSKEEK